MKRLSREQAYLILNGLPHVGPVLLRRLMDAFAGDPVSILSADAAALTKVKGVGARAADVLQHWSTSFNLEREQTSMHAKGVRFISRDAEGFPELLLETYDPPIGLYWKGEYALDRPCVAIVGTRRATLYGLKTAKQFAGELARQGFCIVSGMARGTDTAAHQGALEVGGKTIAVCGCGLDIVYPPENLELYKRIADEGAVVSEFPLGRRADRQTFPMRNRVVAGMSQAVIVIESDRAGGSMITARFAGEQGRTLMAVPGRIDQVSSAGCHQLIRDGAIMVTSVDDILEEMSYRRVEPLEFDFGEPEEVPSAASVDLSADEVSVLQRLRGGERLSADALSIQLEQSAAAISVLLMGLELKRMIAKRADGCFEAIV